MASIKKRKGSQVYQAQFYVPHVDPITGEKGLRQVRQTTGKTRKSEALLVAAELERAARGVLRAGTDKAQQAKAILATMSAEIERGTFNGQSAHKNVTALLKLATGEVLQTYTIEGWHTEWLRRKERSAANPNTVKRYRNHYTALLEWLGEERSNRPLEALTGQEARQWRDCLQDGGRGGRTVSFYVKTGGAIFRAAIAEGIVSFNPFATLEAVDTSDSHERKPFTGEEVAKLASAAPTEEWRGLVLVAAFTGLRLGDAAALSWEAVDLGAKRITLIPQKTKRSKKEITIPIHPDLLSYLLAAPVTDDSPTAPVFPSLTKMGVGARNGLSQSFTKLMAAAGVDRGKPSRIIAPGEEKGAGRITWERGFHSLRHTFTTWLRNAGVSEEDRMALTGHSTRDAHATYSHADEKAGRDAISKLPSLNPKKSKS